MKIGLCIACQYGDHSGHVERVLPPEGMLGGSECPCRGGCKPTAEIQAQMDAVLRALSPTGQLYRTIVVDPPWEYWGPRPPTAKADRKVAVAEFYPTMTHAAIAALPVLRVADDNAHIYMWVTNAVMFEEREGWNSQRILSAWGFQYKTLLTWYKTGPLGLGHYFRGRTEHCLFGVRGGLPIAPSQREPNILVAPNRAHSEKPDCFYDMVERVSPGPYLELFARRARFGWDYWGDESLQTVEMPHV